MAKSLLKFAREVKQEGQKVVWPTRKETITTSIVVIIMVFIMSMILLVSDLVIATGVEAILGLGAK
jgi:preprotein translocase subunit SecE